MQYTLIDLINEDHILVGIDAADAGDAIRQITHLFVLTNHAFPEFADDVISREGTFPTGLPTEPLAVAIPHADPDQVSQSAVAVGLLNAPVKFSQMGTDGSIVLDVTVIFLLAIKETEKQVDMIQQLITLIQSPDILVKLSAAEHPSDVMDIIRTVVPGNKEEE